MQEEFFNTLIHSISEKRITPYYRKPNDNKLDVLSRYMWNVALSESLYPSLNFLEITLRNNLYEAISKAFHQHWLDRCDLNILRDRSVDMVNDAQRRLVQNRKSPFGGNLIAELSFGFWTSLFNARYERHLWRKLFAEKSDKRVFPAMLRHSRKRKVLSSRLNNIRDLRNRIFHHEPIWHLQDLGQKHGEILETIFWFNPRLRETVQVIDRFPEMYAQGTTNYRRHLEDYINRTGYV